MSTCEDDYDYDHDHNDNDDDDDQPKKHQTSPDQCPVVASSPASAILCLLNKQKLYL